MEHPTSHYEGCPTIKLSAIFLGNQQGYMTQMRRPAPIAVFASAGIVLSEGQLFL